MDRHDELVEQVIARHGGESSASQGDGRQVLFRSALDAVAAAAELQAAFDNEAWPYQAQVRVRIGIDAGDLARTEREIRGRVRHRAARVGAAAWGGQILVSDIVALVVEGRLPQGVSARALGTFPLKGFESAVLYQIDRQSLRTDFPPPRLDAEPKPGREALLNIDQLLEESAIVYDFQDETLLEGVVADQLTNQLSEYGITFGTNQHDLGSETLRNRRSEEVNRIVDGRLWNPFRLSFDTAYHVTGVNATLADHDERRQAHRLHAFGDDARPLTTSEYQDGGSGGIFALNAYSDEPIRDVVFASHPEGLTRLLRLEFWIREPGTVPSGPPRDAARSREAL